MESDYAEEYEELYHHHWWWRSREAMLLDVIRSINLAFPADILDFGCGNGLFFPELRQFGNVRGIETNTGALDALGPFRDAIWTQSLGNGIYDDWRFDLITALDVLEHIEDDSQAVRDLTAMLKPGGYLVATAPASMKLWDHHDVVNGHFRRYTADQLRNVLSSYATVVELRYLFNSLFAPKWLVRQINMRRKRPIAQHHLPSPTINRALTTLNLLEWRVVRPLRIPFGSSLLAVAVKQPEHPA